MSLNSGNKINLSNKPNSTNRKLQNKKVLATGGNHKKYSTNKVKIKYNKPKERKRMLPLIISFE